MISYDALIKRAEKAIKIAQMKEAGSSVHKVNIDTDITKLSGLVVVMHPDYIKTKKEATAPC